MINKRSGHQHVYSAGTQNAKCRVYDSSSVSATNARLYLCGLINYQSVCHKHYVRHEVISIML